MNQSLITGGNGFLGRHLVDSLLKQGHGITLILRNPEQERNKTLIDQWQQTAISSSGASLNIWKGDVTQKNLALLESDVLSSFDHIYHLAAVYDLDAGTDWVTKTNVQGTQNLLDKMTEDSFSGVLHFISSIAVAGDYKGVFSEDMFDEGQNHAHNYHKSKYQSESLVRLQRENGARFDVRIYRPSAIIGHSKTGVIDKIDGPYYLFMVVSALRKILPSWAPLIVPKLDTIQDMVPVDYVVDSLCYISQLKADNIPNKQFCFHLTDPESLSLTQVFKCLLKSADGPKIGLSVPVGGLGKSNAKGIFAKLSMLKHLKAVQLSQNILLNSLRIPESVLNALMPNVQFSAADTLALLSKEGIRPPRFDLYVDTLWDYYNRHLDPAKNRDQLSKKAFSGKTVVITGGSSGIGFASAAKALEYGANVILVARDQKKLDDSVGQLSNIAKQYGGTLESISCDLSLQKSCDALITELLARDTQIDILFNNAGRSIRRSISQSEERFHDLERTMQINYFGAARLMLGLLPSMKAAGGGHIIHSSTMGTMAPTPRFGPYLASKSALDALMDSIAAEYASRNIKMTSIKYPLVKTAMIAPTSDYKEVAAASPEFAAQMFVDAVVDQPRRQVSGTGMVMGAASLFMPNLITQVYSYWYQIWPDGKKEFPEVAIDRALITSVMPKSPF